jgi:hypothetical protein
MLCVYCSTPMVVTSKWRVGREIQFRGYCPACLLRNEVRKMAKQTFYCSRHQLELTIMHQELKDDGSVRVEMLCKLCQSEREPKPAKQLSLQYDPKLDFTSDERN